MKIVKLFDPQKYYQFLSLYWDQLYADIVSYKEVFGFIDEIRSKIGLQKEVADIACGTGLLLQYFKENGYSIFGSDLNSAMLEQAKKKLPEQFLTRKSYHKVLFPKPFPLIISFFNSFAYCQDSETLSKVLTHLKNQLSPHGLIIFDLFITENPKEIFQVKSFNFEDNVYLSRTFYGFPQDNMTFQSFYVFTVFKNQQPQTFTLESTRGIFSEETVRKAIEEANLEVVGIYSNHLSQFDSTIFIAQKLGE